jgi:hypothetical protein
MSSTTPENKITELPIQTGTIIDKLISEERESAKAEEELTQKRLSVEITDKKLLALFGKQINS